MTNTEPEIDQLTGTVISEQGGGEIVDGRQDPPMSVYADDESAEGGVTPSLLEAEKPAAEPAERDEALDALLAEAAEAYRAIHAAVLGTADRLDGPEGEGEDLYADRFRVINAAFAYWLGNTVG